MTDLMDELTSDDVEQWWDELESYDRSYPESFVEWWCSR